MTVAAPATPTPCRPGKHMLPGGAHRPPQWYGFYALYHHLQEVLAPQPATYPCPRLEQTAMVIGRTISAGQWGSEKDLVLYEKGGGVTARGWKFDMASFTGRKEGCVR